MTVNKSLETLTENKPGARKFYHQLLALQDNLFIRAMQETKDNAKSAACARAWEVLEERKRIMRGKLKAGSINAQAKDMPNGRSRSKDKPRSAARGPACGVTPPTDSSPDQPPISLLPQPEQSPDNQAQAQ